MNRRYFIELSSLSFLGFLLPKIQSPATYTYGAWIMPVNSTPLDYPCLGFSLQTGTEAQRDAFFAAIGEYAHLRARGFYGFSYPRLLTREEETALRGLFDERCAYHLPIIRK